MTIGHSRSITDVEKKEINLYFEKDRYQKALKVLITTIVISIILEIAMLSFSIPLFQKSLKVHIITKAFLFSIPHITVLAIAALGFLHSLNIYSPGSKIVFEEEDSESEEPCNIKMVGNFIPPTRIDQKNICKIIDFSYHPIRSISMKAKDLGIKIKESEGSLKDLEFLQIACCIATNKKAIKQFLEILKPSPISFLIKISRKSLLFGLFYIRGKKKKEYDKLFKERIIYDDKRVNAKNEVIEDGGTCVDSKGALQLIKNGTEGRILDAAEGERIIDGNNKKGLLWQFYLTIKNNFDGQLDDCLKAVGMPEEIPITKRELDALKKDAHIEEEIPIVDGKVNFKKCFLSLCGEKALTHFKKNLTTSESLVPALIFLSKSALLIN